MLLSFIYIIQHKGGQKRDVWSGNRQLSQNCNHFFKKTIYLFRCKVYNINCMGRGDLMESFDVWEYFRLTDLPRLTYWLTIFLTPAGIGASVMSLSQLRNFELPKQRKNLFRLLFISVIAFLFMHFLRVVLQEFRWDSLRVLLPVVTFIEFLASGFIPLFISLFLIETASPQKLKKAVSAFFFVLAGIHSLLLIIAQFNGMYYSFPTIELGNDLYFINYVRGNGYFISNIAPAAMLLADVVLYVRYRKSFEKILSVAFWIYILLPIAAATAQLFYSDAQFIIWATVIATLVMFTAMMKQMTEEYKRQKTESARLETEMSMAAKIQEAMLPNAFPAFPDRKEFDIFASMNPAKEVGGDFYNFFMIDGDTLGIIIADVSDKGVPAALFMMSSDILLKNHMLTKKSPKAVLEEVNRLICESNREEMFVTVWLGILDIKTGRLTAANAGHEKPAIKSADGSFELYKDRHGMMVGYLDNIKYSEYELTLEKGSKLFLYTDGVVEANNAGNEQFGTVRMTEALRSAENGTPKEILKAVDDAIKGFVNDVPQFDDITMLCLEYKGTQVE